MRTLIDTPEVAPAAAPVSRRRWGFGLSLLALATIPAVMKLLFVASYPGSDDAFIHLQVIKQLASGGAWGINPGQAVNLSSSPMFTLALWGLHTLGLGGIGDAQVFTALCTTLALVLVGLALMHVTPDRRLVLIGVALATFNVNLWRWNGTVMEATLACLVVSTALWWRYRLVSRRPSMTAVLVLGLIVGAGVLVRFEVFILVGCFAVDLLLQGRGWRSVAVLVAGAAVPIAIWVAGALATFSNPLPTTFYAKASSWHILNVAVGKQFVIVMATSCAVPLLVAAAAIVTIARREKAAGVFDFFREHIVLVAFPVLLFAFYYLRTDELQSAARYILPVTLLPAVLAIAAVQRVRSVVPADTAATAAVSESALARSRWLLGAVAAQVVVSLILFATTVVPVLTKFNSGYRATMTGVAAYLSKHCAPGDVALMRIDIGVVSYEQRGGCRLADGGALASPELRGLDVNQQIRRTHPTYVVESLGRFHGDLGTRVPGLQLVWSRGFGNYGVGISGRSHYVTNIYMVEPGGNALIGAGPNCQ